MKAYQAKEIAVSWLNRQLDVMSGLVGAYISGSFLTADSEMTWSESSDLDLVLVFAQGKVPQKPGKLREQGLLLEITVMEENVFSSFHDVMTTHYLAFALDKGEILYDPTGFFSALQKRVSECYGNREWVTARCGDLMKRIENGAKGFDTGASLGNLVNSWAFPTGITCFPILAADLENCTVRKRYTAARVTLEKYGLEDFNKRLISLLAPKPLGRRALLYHLEKLERVFDIACQSRGASASLPFRSDISQGGKAVAIGGSREIIMGDYPEESIFWLLATFARCQVILEQDNLSLAAQYAPGLEEMLVALEIYSPQDMKGRLQGTVDFLPELREITERIICCRENFGNFKKILDSGKSE